jgi:hypothetical protein
MQLKVTFTWEGEAGPGDGAGALIAECGVLQEGTYYRGELPATLRDLLKEAVELGALTPGMDAKDADAERLTALHEFGLV